MARQPLHSLLVEHGILAAVARELLLEALRQEAPLEGPAADALRQRIAAELGGPPPASLQGDWLAPWPEEQRQHVRRYWNQWRLQQALEARYGDRLEAHFLARRGDLEQVVFRLMRLPRQGLAEELYLRLVDDRASFGELAASHGLGDETITRGIVGPIEISQLHPSLRAALRGLTEGQTHPPFPLDGTLLLVRLEHRRPASLQEPMRQRLLEELLQHDLPTAIDAALTELLRSPQPAVDSGAAETLQLEARR